MEEIQVLHNPETLGGRLSMIFWAKQAGCNFSLWIFREKLVTLCPHHMLPVFQLDIIFLLTSVDIFGSYHDFSR